VSTDPWCKKCPFLMECIQLDIDPQSMTCETQRWAVGQLNAEDTWLDELRKDLEWLFREAPL